MPGFSHIMGVNINGQIVYPGNSVSRMTGRPWNGRLRQDPNTGGWFEEQYGVLDDFGDLVDSRDPDAYDYDQNKDKSGAF